MSKTRYTPTMRDVKPVSNPNLTDVNNTDQSLSAKDIGSGVPINYRPNFKVAGPSTFNPKDAELAERKFGTTTFNPNMSPQDLRYKIAEDYSGGGNILRGGWNAAVAAAGGFVGSLADPAGMLIDGIFGTTIQEGYHDLIDGMKAEVFATREQDEAFGIEAMKSGTWWASSGADGIGMMIGFAGSFALAGMGASRALTYGLTASKATQASAMASKIAKVGTVQHSRAVQGLTAVYMGVAESAMETYETSRMLKEKYAPLVQQGIMTQEQADERNSSMTSAAFWSNMGVSIASNLVFGAVVGEYLIGQKIMGKSASAATKMEDGLHSSVNRLVDSFKGVGFKEGAKTFGKATLAIGAESLSEYGEEYAQTIIQNYIENVSDLDVNLSQEDRYTWGELMGGIWGHMKDGWQLGEAEQAAFLGALLGGTSATAAKVGENMEFNKNRKKLYDYLTQNEQSLNNGFKNFYQKKDGELVLDEEGKPKIDWDNLRKEFKNVGSKIFDGLAVSKAMESGNYTDVEKKLISSLIIPSAFAYVNMGNNGKERYLESIKKVFEAHGFIKANESLPEALEKQYTEVYDMLKEENDKVKGDLPETIANAISDLRSDQGFLSRMFYGEKSSKELKSNAQLTKEQRKEFKTRQEAYIESAQRLSSEYAVRIRMAKQQLEESKKALEEVFVEDPLVAAIDPDPANQTQEQKDAIAKEKKRESNFESRRNKTLPNRLRTLELELEQLETLQDQLLDPEFIKYAFKEFSDKPTITYMNEYQTRVKTSYNIFLAELEKLGHIETVKDDKGNELKKFTGKSAVVIKDSKGDLWYIVEKKKGKEPTGNFSFVRLEPKRNKNQNKVDLEFITLDSREKSNRILSIEDVLNPANILSIEEAQKIMNNRDIVQVNKEIKTAIERLIKKINTELVKARGIYNKTPAELEETRKKLEKLKRKSYRTKASKHNLAAVQAEIQKLEEEIVKLEADIVAKEAAASAPDEVAAMKERISKLKASVESKNSIANLLEDIKTVEDELKTLEAGLNTADRTISALRSELTYLKASLETLEALVEKQKTMDLSSEEVFIPFKPQTGETVLEVVGRTAPDLLLTLEKARNALKQSMTTEIANMFINFTPETLALFTEFENELLKSKASINKQISTYKRILERMRKFLAMEVASGLLSSGNVLDLYKRDSYFKTLYDKYSDDILRWTTEIPRPIANPNLTPHQQREQQKILDIRWEQEEKVRKEKVLDEFSKRLLEEDIAAITEYLRDRTKDYLKTRGMYYKTDGKLAVIEASLAEMYAYLQEEPKMEAYLQAANETVLPGIETQLAELYSSAEYEAATLGKAVSRIKQTWDKIQIILQNGIADKSIKDRFNSNPEQDPESLLAHLQNVKGKTHKKGSMYTTINGILKEGKTIEYRNNPSSINATKWINSMSTKKVRERGLQGTVFNGEQLREILPEEQLGHGLPFTKDDLYVVPTVDGNPEKFSGMVVFFGIAKVSTYFPEKGSTTINAESLYQKHLEKHRTPEEIKARKNKVVTVNGETLYPKSRKEAVKLFIERVMKPEYKGWRDSLIADINNGVIPILEIDYVSKGMHVLNKDENGNIQMQDANKRYSKDKQATRPRVVVNSKAFTSGHKSKGEAEYQKAINEGLIGSAEGSKFGAASLVLPNEETTPIFNKKMGNTAHGEKAIDFIVKVFGYLGQNNARIGDTWALGQNAKIAANDSQITMFPKKMGDSILSLFINVKRNSNSEIETDKDSSSRQLVDYEISVFRNELGSTMIAYKPKGAEKVIIDPRDLVIVGENGIPLIDHTNPVVQEFIRFLKEKPHNIDARALTPASFFGTHKFSVPEHINYKTRRVWSGKNSSRYDNYEHYVFEEVAQVSVAEEVDPNEPRLINRYLKLSPYQKSESVSAKEATVSKVKSVSQESTQENKNITTTGSLSKVITAGVNYYVEHSTSFLEKIRATGYNQPNIGSYETFQELNGKSVFIFARTPEYDPNYATPVYRAQVSFESGVISQVVLNPLLAQADLPTSLSSAEVAELQDYVSSVPSSSPAILAELVMNFLNNKGYILEVPNSYTPTPGEATIYESAVFVVDSPTHTSTLSDYSKEIADDTKTISCK